MSAKGSENENPQSAKVLQLGFNISVSGDPDTDFQILLDDKQQKDVLQLQGSATNAPKQEVEDMNKQEEPKPAHLTGAIPKKKYSASSNSSESSKSRDGGQLGTTSCKDSNLIDDIRSTMEHFERFSDHVKEIPRLKSHPLATSTPFSDKQNSKSESSLIYPEYKPRRFPHLYDFYSRKEYFKGSVKPLPPDLFLKPLPGEDLYKRGNFMRHLDLEPYRHYGSVDSLNKSSALCTKSKYDFEKYDLDNLISEAPVGILKKSDSESGDKQSTSSADSIKDIRIYQSGGIIIMQNFKENMELTEKKEISDFSAKLIENCHKLREEIRSGFPDERLFIGNSSDEGKNSGKMVQFDLSGFENHKSKSSEVFGVMKDDCSPGKLESSESTSDCVKNKDTSPQGTSQSQDLPSLSTQENDSVASNQPGMSPTFASAKKLEWDSGADVGYLNVDLSKENLSTIERIVLKGISSDGLKEKKVVFEKKPEQAHPNRSKFILERLPSDPVIEEILEDKEKVVESSKKDKQRSNRAEEDVKHHEDEPCKSITSGVAFRETSSRDGSQSAEEKIKPSTRENVGKEVSRNERSPEEVKPKQSTDKSVNVNTLFQDSDRRTPTGINSQSLRPGDYPSRVKGVKLSPKIKKLKKKKSPSQRNLTAPLKEKIDSIIDIARCSGRRSEGATLEMGIPKRIYKKLEAKPEFRDVELSRDVEEIIIDQRFKIKQNVAVGRELGKASHTSENVESKMETKTKSRPISASSSSNNTVLPKEAAGEKETAESNKFTDQTVQTTDCKVESVGIQAFASLKSSEKSPKVVVKESKNLGKENTSMSSKNIQSFGLNSSLPKELAHPREVKASDGQNTKGTQFFGGPVNSLPNYHASLATKPGESCGRLTKVLKAKKNLEAEIIRVREENEKNIMANESAAVIAEPKRRRDHNAENKENLMRNSKRTQSNASRNASRGTRNSEAPAQLETKESKSPDSKPKNKSEGEPPSPEISESLRTSEEVSSKVLTSEVLKEHGDSIDRNIIQEKYFQSQMIELEKREMISRSTSMEKKSGQEGTSGRELVTVGCQYSPQSKEASEGESNCREPGRGKPNNRTGTSEQYDSSQNLMEEERFETSKSTNQGQEFDPGESLPSSTQTAHSWIPGMQDLDQNAKSGVGRARSFEYLPGHIYESSGNLREELPSETDRNLITGSSSEANMSGEAKDSEGRNTLVLENSSGDSYESDRLKILSENLTQLDLVVSRLREKDARIERITQTLLVNLWRGNGAGDSDRDLDSGGGRRESSSSNPKEGRVSPPETPDSRKEECGDGDSAVSSRQTKRKIREKETSIACQTEEKSSASDPGKFYEERKALEKRISAEKESQIKWIENEIHHLNILRGLLEKQNLPRRKRSSTSATSNEESKSQEKYSKETPGEVYPATVTPVYGCTISLTENKPPWNGEQSREENPRGNPCAPETAKYGMALSLTQVSKNLQSVVPLPVELQLTLKDNKPGEECVSRAAGSSRTHCHRPSRTPSPESNCGYTHPANHRHWVCQSDMNTQFPSLRRSPKSFATNFAQTSFSSPPPGRCPQCGQANCVCLDFSEKSFRSRSGSCKSKPTSRRESPRISFENNGRSKSENMKTTSNSTGAGLQELESDFVSKASIRLSDSRQESKCRCGKCPRKGVAAASRPGTPCRGSCRSNIYLNCCGKASEGLGPCRCSKIQVQRSSACACHVIKIHGSKCCPEEKGPEPERARTPPRPTQNQCSQTDDIPALRKDLSEPDFVELPEEYEDLPGEEYGREIEEAGIAQERRPVCSCQRKAERQKSESDNHPRHYFLKIEETEVEDESNDSTERRKSLEVITVKVPVKKAGKAKIYGNRIRQTPGCEEYGESVEPSGKACNCCGGCAPCRKQYQGSDGRGYRKGSAERTESSGRGNYYPAPAERDAYGESNYPGRCRDPNGQSSSSQEFHQWRSGAKPQYFEGTRGYSDAGNFASRDFQNGYDSHQEDRRRNDEEYGAEWRTKPQYERDGREPRPQTTPADPYSSDYYNYNKKEFMTKSELMREEEKSRRGHQPSLQECLASNRPDFCSSAESRRQIISERARERVRRHNNRMECLVNLIHQCDGRDQPRNGGPKRIFTTSQMKEQTMRKYKKLPEVTGKIAEEKKKQEYRTNKLMGDIYGKKLQMEALKGSCICDSDHL